MDELYREYILDHYKNPRNFGELEPHDVECFDRNPLCGDEMGVQIKLEGDRIADLVNRENVCIRAGHHCAMPLMRRLGVPATARASLGPYNDRADVDALVAALAQARKIFSA